MAKRKSKKVEEVEEIPEPDGLIDLTHSPLDAYKGFNAEKQNGHLVCRGYEYEVGKTHVMDAVPDVCNIGFHACSCPVEVMSYYPPNRSRYGKVEQGGMASTMGDDRNETKMASTEIKILQQYPLKTFVKVVLHHNTVVDEESGTEFCSRCSSPEYGGCEVFMSDRSHSCTVADDSNSVAWAELHRSIAAVMADKSVAVTERTASMAGAFGDNSWAISLRMQSVAAGLSHSTVAETRGEHSVAAATATMSEARTFGDSSVAVCTDKTSFAVTLGKCSMAVSSLSSCCLWVQEGAAVGTAYKLTHGKDAPYVSDYFRVDKAGSIVVTVYTPEFDFVETKVYQAGKDFELGSWYCYQGGLSRCAPTGNRMSLPPDASKLVLTDEDLVLECKKEAEEKFNEKNKK
jgi:hypothetical protein